MKRIFIKNLIPMLAAATLFGLSACGGGAGGSSPSPSAPSDAGQGANIRLSLKLTGVSPAPAVTNRSAIESNSESRAETQDGVGTPITLTGVRFNIRDIEFSLSEGTTCQSLSFNFAPPVACKTEQEVEKEVENEVENEAENETHHSSDTTMKSDVSGESESEPEGDKIEVEGPLIADLMAGTTLPSLTNVFIPAGSYPKIEVRLSEAKAEDGLLTAGDPLIGHTLVADGSFVYQGAPHALSVRLKFSAKIRFENPNGIQVSQTGANDIVMTLDPGKWFQGIDLARCLDEGNLTFQADGSLLIDEHSGHDECNIENIVKENIRDSGSVTREEDDASGEAEPENQNGEHAPESEPAEHPAGETEGGTHQGGAH
ncbi:MAG: hypothetical protein U1F57_08375 [bacterium]